MDTFAPAGTEHEPQPNQTARQRAARARARLARRWWRREIVGSVDYANVVARVDAEAGLSPRYLFMILMSAGIAVLGLLLSSPAVIIGAMLISPLMGPIIGLGFALAIFEWREVRRSLAALAVGSALAVVFCALVVALSPLQAVTPEILARTRPNLFDLLVAVFSALAGTYATIRGRGETIVGVAIATALMPPLSVVGFGLATGNAQVFGGAFALFMTNLLAIALSAGIMARFYGFGTELSPRQTRMQAALIFGVFILMSVPLALALRHIAWEAVASRQVRSEIAGHFGDGARVSQLEIDFAADPLRANALVLTEAFMPGAEAAIGERIEARLGRPATLQLNQLVVDQDESRLEQERSVLDEARQSEADTQALAAAVTAFARVSPGDVAVDKGRRLVVVQAGPAATIPALHDAELRLGVDYPRWTIRIVPAFGPLPTVPFQAGGTALNANGMLAARQAGWALERWGVRRVTVVGRTATAGDGPAGDAAARMAARADAVAVQMEALGLAAGRLVDPPGPAQRAAEREGGFALFRSVAVQPDLGPVPAN